MKKFEKLAGGALGLLLPLMAAAATLDDTLGVVKQILNLVIGILFILVTLYFVWGVVQYVGAGGEEAKIKTGKQHMIWGLIGLAVMAGAWGLVNILLDTFLRGANTNIPKGPQQF